MSLDHATVPEISLVRQFDSLYALLDVDALLQQNPDNRQGGYAWVVSPLLESLIQMFEFTGDELYLDNFVLIGEVVLARRDDRVQVKDYAGILGPGWSTRRRWEFSTRAFTNVGAPVRDLVQDARIVLPFARFAKAVRSTPTVGTNWQSYADRYEREVEQVLASLVSEWWNESRGRCVFPKGSPYWCDGADVPQNYESQLGSLILLLPDSVPVEKYYAIVDQLARNLRGNIWISGERALWTYASGNLRTGWRAEESISVRTPAYVGSPHVSDVSHAGLDVAFMVECVLQGLEFSESDLRPVIETFHGLCPTRKNFATHLDGRVSTAGQPVYRPSYYWTRLAWFDRKVHHSMTSVFFDGRALKPTVPYLHLLSSLVAYGPTQRPRSRSVQ